MCSSDLGVDWLAARGVPRALAVVVALVSLALAITAIVLVLLPVLASQIPVLQERFPMLLDAFDRAVRPALTQIGLAVHLDSAGMKTLLAQKLAGTEGLGTSLLNGVRAGGSAVLGLAATLLLVPVVLFYLLQIGRAHV